MRTTRSEVLLAAAALFATRSTCNRLNVGAVLARDGRILTTGYNGSPSGMPHCEHPSRNKLDPNGSCHDVVHAEANALIFAAKYGIATDGAHLYTTHAPCLACALLIINAGIKVVIYRHEFRDMSGVELLKSAQVSVANA